MIDHAKRELRLTRWNDECTLNVNYARAEPADLLESRAHVKARDLYALDIVLKKRPGRNSWVYPLRGKGLRFSYQPPLTVEETEAGCVRPDNVVGSYAVYHESKKHNRYETGKFCHIYRPEAVDALGNRGWCSLHVNKKATLLTVTVPQEFLDGAIYPVMVDPDFGYTTIGSSIALIAESGPFTWRRGSAWPMPAPGGTANYIKAFIGATVGAQTPDCTVFINQKDSVAANQHGQIATAENLACAAGPHWEEFTLAGEVLVQAVVYILNIMADADGFSPGDEYVVCYDDNGAVASYEETQNYGGPESPWVVNPEGTTRDYSIYCNYSTGWSGKISGVTNPAKIMGIPVIGIAKVKGIPA